MYTPQEVSEKTFPKSTGLTSGYNMTAVDEFLDGLTEDYTALYKDNTTLKAKLKMLAEKGVPTHFVQELSDRETLVKKVQIVPLEVIVRNVAAGSFTKRLGVPEGTVLKCPTLEFSYKNDDLHDPLINHYHALALGLATQEEIDTISDYAFKVNRILSEYLLGFNIRLIDFKLEFGRLADGTIVLADEISPDTCRFWDATTGAHLDKDLFRRDLGGEEEAYQEVMARLLG